ncbi:MAG TPA: hypothetical protein PLV83_03155 [Bacilli bacterium]|nr:hypothetical protein [Bacilli bacterium]
MQKYSTSVSKLVKKSELYNYLELDKNSKEEILKKFGFDISTINIDESEITLKISEDVDLTKINPTVIRSYYDENDVLSEIVKKVPNKSELVTFEGEIYEQLNFKSYTEASKFADLHNYGSHVFKDTVALIHFKGMEWNDKKIEAIKNMQELTKRNNGVISERSHEILLSDLRKALETKEFYVVKNNRYYNIYFGSVPFIEISSKKNGFSIKEIDNIIHCLEYESPDKGYFSLYARDALKLLRTNLLNRGYNPKTEFIDIDSMETYIDSITSVDTADNDIYLKLKVISNVPSLLIDAEEQFDVSNEVAKVYTKKLNNN